MSASCAAHSPLTSALLIQELRQVHTQVGEESQKPICD